MTSANIVIIQLLHTKTDHSEFLRLCWDKLSETQKKEIFHFLYITSQNKTFLSTLRLEINSTSPVILWSHFFSILKQIHKLKTETILLCKNSSVCSEELGRFRIHHPELNSLWNKRKNEILNNYTEKKLALLKSLDFARQQGFKEQKLKILDDLTNLYPNDPEVLAAINTERELQARNTIHKVFQKKLSKNEWFPLKEQEDPNLIKGLMKSSKKALKKHSQRALDIAIMLYQMELHQEALEIIDGIRKPNESVLWHSLQMAIDGNQYARALSTIETLRTQHINNENSFSLMYYQALSLYGLGKTNEARQIISNILKIRPGFKSADSLLIEWDNEK